MNGAPQDVQGPRSADPPQPSTAISSLLRTLVQHYVPSSRVDNALSVATRLLDCTLTTAPSLQSADSITRAMTFHLMCDGKEESANNLAAITTSLKFERAISQNALCPLLHVLNTLRAPRRSRDDPVLSGADTPRPSHPPAGLFSPTPNPSTTTTPSHHMDPTASIPISQTPASASKHNHIAVPAHTQSLENILVQDLLLIVQGEHGKHLSFSGEGPDESINVSLPPGVALSIPMHDMVHYIGELGFLFRVIRHRVAQVIDSNSAGLVEHNFCTAIDCELDHYYRSLVTLRESSRRSDDIDVADSSLTLRRMFVWSERERHRLRWLARICEETRPLSGCQILAHLRTRRGRYIATDVRDLMRRVIRSSAAPINTMLARWLSEGVLFDEYGEFFIMEDPQVAATISPNPFSAEEMEDSGLAGGLAGGPNVASSSSNRVWWDLFKLRDDMLPGCIDPDLADRVLITGKSIAFMRRCCGETQWVDEFHVPLVVSLTATGISLFEEDGGLDNNALNDVIEKARVSASKRLKDLFFERFDLNHHFGAIKRYLLLSQGDFAQSLMDGLANVLDNGNEMLHHNLAGYIDAALQSCSSFNADTDWDILERLDVLIESKDTTNKVGWDAFSLTYRVEDAPLNTVFSKMVMDAYLLIFRLLWRLKRMDHIISIAYMSLRETERQIRRRALGRSEEDAERKRDIGRVVKRVHFVRMKMTHLVHNMQHYCKVEVLEGCWAVLERQLKEAQDLGQMIRAHSNYLTQIRDMTLQSARSEYVVKELNAVLDTVPRFSRVQKQVCLWAMTTAQPEVGGAWDVGNTEDMMAKVTGIEKQFDRSFSRFIQVLTTHCQMVDECLFLLFRLDYNEHHSRIVEEAAQSTSTGESGEQANEAAS